MGSGLKGEDLPSFKRLLSQLFELFDGDVDLGLLACYAYDLPVIFFNFLKNEMEIICISYGSKLQV
jgi:hypothetical protein